jgi:hypothetical protein
MPKYEDIEKCEMNIGRGARRQRRLACALPALLVLLALAACGARPAQNPPPTATGVAPALEESYVIRSNTQAHIDENLSLATGNFWEEQYVDGSGGAQFGLTAGLWIDLRGQGAGDQQNSHLRVHPGQEIAIGDYRISVQEVNGPDQSIKVAVVRS